MTLRLLLRGSGACVAAGLAVFGWSHSRWGPKAKASLKEFQRCSFNPPPANWTGPTFKPRLDYPAKCPRSSTAENPPWTDIDFKKEPERYMQQARSQGGFGGFDRTPLSIDFDICTRTAIDATYIYARTAFIR